MTPVGFTLHPALQPRRRWTAARKADVVISIRRKEITADQAIAAHGLTGDELASWMERYRRHGQDGLATLTLQETRV
jgi:transposase-like protein